MGKRIPVVRKRFSQNFLQDVKIRRIIVDSAALQVGDHVLEIGPGRGAITEVLLAKNVRLTAVEVDRDLVLYLNKRFGDNPGFRLIEEDILNLDWSELLSQKQKIKLVANLPYHISTPLFFKFIQYRSSFESLTIMVQKELAQRFCHDGRGKNLKNYGVLSVIACNLFSAELICEVPPTCFNPVPQVDSAVIRLLPRQVSLDQEKEFFNFVKNSFNQRRKRFLGYLKKWNREFFDNLNQKSIEFLQDKRPENITPAQFLKLFQTGQLSR
jgi:16S rRNA (adenine1518-N6/adenine1519-N6)-dimethyltransferase